MAFRDLFNQDYRTMNAAVSALKQDKAAWPATAMSPDNVNPKAIAVKNQFELFLRSQPREDLIRAVIADVNAVSPELAARLMQTAATGPFA